MSAMVTDSSTDRRLARTATQTLLEVLRRPS